MRTSSTGIGLLAMLVAACSSESASVSPTAFPSSSVPSPSLAACPNPEGGACLGPLTAGTYSTSELELGLTYTVSDGWGNYEDYPGGFLLVPPSGTLEGVNAGNSDYVGVGIGVAAASANCDIRAEPGIETDARGDGCLVRVHPRARHD